jgi:nitronate monooxygenase
VNLTVGLCPQIEEMRDVVIEEGIRAVETAAYRAEDHGRKLKEAGVKWIHKVATMKHALAAERQGADAVVIVGLEGTGFKHSSQLPTLISITWAVKQIKIPVIAAGGIGDARGFLAALSMGAEGVYMGTAFMATDECPVPEQFKQALVKADPTDPTYRERCLATSKSEEYERVMRMKGSVPLDRWLSELRGAQVTPLEGGRSDDMEEVGRLRGGSLAVAVIDEVVSVRKRIEEIVRGAEEIVTSGNFPRVRNFLTVKE